MPNDFTGLVDLLDDEGAVVEAYVRAALRKRVRRGLVQWGGRLGPHHDQQDWDPVSQVKLPSGDVGNVILARVQVGRNKTARAKGSGPAPF